MIYLKETRLKTGLVILKNFNKMNINISLNMLFMIKITSSEGFVKSDDFSSVCEIISDYSIRLNFPNRITFFNSWVIDIFCINNYNYFPTSQPYSC